MRRSMLVIVGAALLAASACNGSWRPSAATVNGEIISPDRIDAITQTFRNDPVLINGLQIDDSALSEDRAPLAVAQETLQAAIAKKVLADGLAREGLAVTDADRETAWSETFSITKEDLAALPEKLTDAGMAYLEDRAEVRALQDVYLRDKPQAEQLAALTELFAQAKITVNPRYGQWDPVRLTVVPLGDTGDTGATSVDTSLTGGS